MKDNRFLSVNKAFVSLLLLTNLLNPSYSHSEQGKELRFAVVPQFTHSVIQNQWGPLVSQLSEVIGSKIRLVLYQNMSAFETAIEHGEPDMVYMNPYQVVAIRKKGVVYHPIIRDGSQSLTGILVVLADDGIQSLQDLNGSVIAFPSPKAFAASMYLQSFLINEEHINYIPVYARTHSNSYRYVIYGKAAAAGGVNKTLSSEPDVVKDKLKVIYRTPALASHPVSVHERVPTGIRELAIKYFVNLEKSHDGQKLLNAVQIIKPVIANYERDYMRLEKLNFDSFID